MSIWASPGVRVTTGFSIPMRGNEYLPKGLMDELCRVFDPHEG